MLELIEACSTRSHICGVPLRTGAAANRYAAEPARIRATSA